MSFFRIRHLQKEKLRDNDVGDHVIDGCAEKNDAIHEQARINIVAPFAAPGLFDDVWNEKILHNKMFRVFTAAQPKGAVRGGQAVRTPLLNFTPNPNLNRCEED